MLDRGDPCRGPQVFRVALALAAFACAGCRRHQAAPPAVVQSAPESAMPRGFDNDALKRRADWRAKVLASGLFDAATQASIDRGRALFSHQFTVEEGLGPHFNNSTCVNCHRIPQPLGRGPVAEAAHAIGGGVDDAFGLRPRHTLDGYPPFQLPPGWKELGHRLPPPLAGLGWIEAVPAEQIYAQKHTDKPLAAAVVAGSPVEVRGWARPRPETGRGSMRFAVKMVVATIDEFVAGAFSMEMGITSPQRTLDHDADKAADPEVTADQIADVANFVAFSPPPGQPLAEADQPGLERFRQAGCADCHWSNFTVEGKPAPQMYSDLLAHDMGAALAETLRDEATPAGHYRTTPLWGLRDHPGPFLHDGSATTLEGAILRHGGEATGARDRFQALAPDARAAMVRMLSHL